MLSLLVLPLHPTFCEASPISLAYRHSWLMAAKPLSPKKDSMPTILRQLHCPPMTVVSFFSFFTAKISCYILVTVLVHKGKLQAAYKSATCNLSLWIKARTEHACLKASEFLIIHASLSPFLSFICSKTELLLCTATPHTFAKRHRVCHHTDTLG